MEWDNSGDDRTDLKTGQVEMGQDRWRWDKTGADRRTDLDETGQVEIEQDRYRDDTGQVDMGQGTKGSDRRGQDKTEQQ